MLTYPDIAEINALIKPRRNQYFESLGLSYYSENETMQGILLEKALSGDKLTYGYFGYPYICKSFGDLKIIARSFPEEVRYSDADKFEISVTSSCIWKVRIENNKYFRTWPSQNQTLVRSMDGKHQVVINILNIDVLPSVKKNEVIELGMMAFAADYRIFEDEGTYADSIKPGIDGQRPLMDSDTAGSSTEWNT